MNYKQNLNTNIEIQNLEEVIDNTSNGIELFYSSIFPALYYLDDTSARCGTRLRSTVAADKSDSTRDERTQNQL